MIVTKKVALKTTKSNAWKLLTNPEMTKQYMFGCEVVSDWKVGSPITWKGYTEDGKEVIYVKGHITEITKEEKVTFTMFDPNMGIEDIPENYVLLTYELKEQNNSMLLILTQGDFANVARGQSRYDETIKGWEFVLPLMKELVEK